MQELIARAKELLADGTVTRVLGWKAGDLPYNPEAAYFETAESLDEFVYNGFCGQNLSKMMIEASKLEGKTLVCLKPCTRIGDIAVFVADLVKIAVFTCGKCDDA